MHGRAPVNVCDGVGCAENEVDSSLYGGDDEDDDSGVLPDPPEVELGDLEALKGVVQFPVRIKCATLGWNTLSEALGD